MQDLLQECSRNFGNAPRQLSLWDRLIYLRIPKPAWLKNRTDDLTTIFQHLDATFSNGVVVWGHIVQANRLMFEAGKDDCPGEVVYSIEDRARIEATELQEIAHALFTLKGTSPSNTDLIPIADYLTDEMIRVFGLEVPRSVSPVFRCKISTTFFARKHLPGRRLCTPFLPLVVNTQVPHVAMPLPEKYWPKNLLNWWTQ